MLYRKFITDSIKNVLKKLIQKTNRFRIPLNKFDYSLEPISREFGLDRGLPIDRFYIEEFLYSNKKYIKGDVLEVAEDKYSKMFGNKNCINHVLLYKDIKNISSKKIICDLTRLDTVPNECIDCFICTQTLNFIYDVKTAIKSIKKMLRPGGCALITVAGISQISQYDYNRWGDYWRFNDLSIKQLFCEYFKPENVKVISYGNLASCVALLNGLAIEDLTDKSFLQIQDKDYQCILGVIAIKEH